MHLVSLDGVADRGRVGRMSADELRQAAKLMRKRASEATPGPWERPLDTRHKNLVIAALPEGEQGQRMDGTIPAEWHYFSGPTGRYAGQRERVVVVSAEAGMLGFARKRSGRDLEHIAGMHPAVALAVADWLEQVADDDDRPPCDSPAGVCNHCERRWDLVIADRVAREYLGVTR